MNVFLSCSPFFGFPPISLAHSPLSFSIPSPPKQNDRQSELSSLAELTGELRAARAASEAKLRLGRRWLKDLKSVILEEIDGDDGDVDGGGEGDGGGSGHPFGDADTVAGRSSGVFSDPALSL